MDSNFTEKKLHNLKSPVLEERIAAANMLGTHKIMSAYLELCWLAFTDLDKDASQQRYLGRISGYKALKQIGCPNIEQLERIQTICANEERGDVLKEFRRILSSFLPREDLMPAIQTIDRALTHRITTLINTLSQGSPKKIIRAAQELGRIKYKEAYAALFELSLTFRLENCRFFDRDDHRNSYEIDMDVKQTAHGVLVKLGNPSEKQLHALATFYNIQLDSILNKINPYNRNNTNNPDPLNDRNLEIIHGVSVLNNLNQLFSEMNFVGATPVLLKALFSFSSEDKAATILTFNIAREVRTDENTLFTNDENNISDISIFMRAIASKDYSVIVNKLTALLIKIAPNLVLDDETVDNYLAQVRIEKMLNTRSIINSGSSVALN